MPLNLNQPKKRPKLAYKKHALTYRHKLRLKKIFKLIGIGIGAVAMLLLLFIVYAGKFVSYDRDGAHIDFRGNRNAAADESAAPTEPLLPIDAQITYETKTPSIAEVGPTKGYYLTTKQLQNAAELIDSAQQVESGTTVMLELKSIYGYFYYHTKIDGAELAEFDIDAVERLISVFKSRGCHLVALIPAFPDNVFAEANFSCALPTAEGYLWLDENRSYWLDPANETVLSYLEQLAKELSSKGFREVVFEDFTIPASSNIDYNSSKSREEVVAEAAKRITSFFAGSNLTISFCTDGEDFPTEALSGRLYIEQIDAAQLDRIVSSYKSDTLDTLEKLVFITDSKDSRFDPYSTMKLFQ